MNQGEILLIDDDEVALLLAGNLLEGAGYRVTSTADGPQGVAIYRAQRPEVVILDLGLPSGNGLGVLKEIREIDPGAKVIVMTGYGGDVVAAEARSLGAIDFLQKPCRPELLLARLRVAASA